MAVRTTTGTPPRQPSGSKVALFLEPASHHFERDRLFDLQTSQFGGADVLAPYLYLRDWLSERGVEVHTADLLASGECGADLNLCVSLGMRDRYGALAERDDVVLSGFLAMECPIVEPALYRSLPELATNFKRILSYSTTDALLPFTRAPVAVERFRIPQSFDAVHQDIWANTAREFLAMINGNKLPRLYDGELYTERLRAVEFFGRHREIDLYGVGWDGPPYRLGLPLPGSVKRLRRAAERGYRRLRPDPLLSAAHRAWRGPVEDKAGTLRRYRFAVCFENMVLEGWITEKLFDCLYAGTVPIYLGAPDIERWVPPECFIDMRHFDDYDQLRKFLLSLRDEDVQRYRDAAREFLASERFRPFSRQAFAALFGRLVEEDAGVRLAPVA